jgi:hypothetical protein
VQAAQMRHGGRKDLADCFLKAVWLAIAIRDLINSINHTEPADICAYDLEMEDGKDKNNFYDEE